jgi:hypothetical protein
VPHRSGIAPKPHCKSLLQVAVEHEPCYKREEGADFLRASQFTVRAIVKLAQGVQQTKIRYE